jgi:cobalt-zinc-cadmium efflux system outer membrane protein
MARCTLLVAIVFSWCASAHAQEAVDLTHVVHLVRTESPLVRALEAQIDAAEGGVDAAGVYPNPFFGYAGFGRFDGNSGAINGTQHQLWLDFPLLFASQHLARRDVAQAEVEALRAQRDVLGLALEVEARRAYLGLQVAQHREARLVRARAELASLESLVAARVSAGAQSEYDAARIAIEAVTLDAELATAQADVTSASRALAVLAGRPQWEPRAAEPLAYGALLTVGLEDIPAVRTARLAVAARERDVHRAEVERVPEIHLALGTYFTTDGDSSSAYLGLGSPLPLFDTGEAEVRRTQAARAAAVELLEVTESRARARLEAARTTVTARRAAVAALDERVAARLPGLRQMAQAAYQLGQSGVFELVDAFRAEVEVELARIELLATAIAAEIDVLAATSE